LIQRIAHRRAPLVLAALFFITVAVAGAPGLQNDVFSLAPFIALLVSLYAGYYPGERLVEKLVAAGHWDRARRPAARVTPVPRIAVVLPRGGRLVATALAGRAPPPGLSFSP
jgi:hypothetical protein